MKKLNNTDDENKVFDKLIKKLNAYTKKNNLRSSIKREYILKTLSCKYSLLQNHFEAEELYEFMKQKNKDISRATIFRSLTLFVEARILKRQNLGENHSHYELADENISNKHHHLICSKCGGISEFFSKDLSVIISTIAKKYNFAMNDCKLEIYGLCKKCQKD